MTAACGRLKLGAIVCPQGKPPDWRPWTLYSSVELAEVPLITDYRFPASRYPLAPHKLDRIDPHCTASFHIRKCLPLNPLTASFRIYPLRWSFAVIVIFSTESKLIQLNPTKITRCFTAIRPVALHHHSGEFRSFAVLIAGPRPETH